MRNFNVPSFGNVAAAATLAGVVSLSGGCSGGEASPDGPARNEEPAATAPQIPPSRSDSWLSTPEATLPAVPSPEATDIIPPIEPPTEPKRPKLPSVAKVILSSGNMCAWAPDYRMPLRSAKPPKVTLDGRCHETGSLYNPDGDPSKGEVSIYDKPHETAAAKMGEVPNGLAAKVICYTLSGENIPLVTDGNGVSSRKWIAVEFTNPSGEGIPSGTGLVPDYVNGYASGRLTSLPKCTSATLERIAAEG